jgi:hypothetical protein
MANARARKVGSGPTKLYAWQFRAYHLDRRIDGFVVASNRERAWTLARKSAAKQYGLRSRDIEISMLEKLSRNRR